jgi:3'-phosphoadenosine 5'-phosphosulfate sulfotransferase (PAPS reductase)/FAD synthetase
MSLDELEAEAIFVLRETVAQASNPVLFYSVGKDSSTLLHLARKAFHPGPVPSLLHVDTGWEFREMYAFRDRVTAELGVELIVHLNEEGRDGGITPEHPDYTDVMKTVALRQALDRHRFDAGIGGARRDEERSRAKERVFSFRDANHRLTGPLDTHTPVPCRRGKPPASTRCRSRASGPTATSAPPTSASSSSTAARRGRTASAPARARRPCCRCSSGDCCSPPPRA